MFILFILPITLWCIAPLHDTQKKVLSSTTVHTLNAHNALYKLKKLSLTEFSGFLAYQKFLNKFQPIISKSLDGIIVINDEKNAFNQYLELARKHLSFIKQQKISLHSIIQKIGAISLISGSLGYLFSYFNASEEPNIFHISIGGIVLFYCSLASFLYFVVQYEIQEECDTLFTRHINRLEYAHTHNH